MHGEGQSIHRKLLMLMEIIAKQRWGFGPLCPLMRGAGQFVPASFLVGITSVSLVLVTVGAGLKAQVWRVLHSGHDAVWSCARNPDNRKRFSGPLLSSFATVSSKAADVGLPPLTAGCIRAADLRRCVRSLHTLRSRPDEGWRCDRKFPPPKQDHERCRGWPFRWSGSVRETAPESRIA